MSLHDRNLSARTASKHVQRLYCRAWPQPRRFLHGSAHSYQPEHLLCRARFCSGGGCGLPLLDGEIRRRPFSGGVSPTRYIPPAEHRPKVGERRDSSKLPTGLPVLCVRKGDERSNHSPVVSVLLQHLPGSSWRRWRWQLRRPPTRRLRAAPACRPRAAAPGRVSRSAGRLANRTRNSEQRSGSIWATLTRRDRTNMQY
ncbi:Protein of unknown function [Gryllus bimaculatus]|nr:Protein of unknown function [Gryllus bimaculatus]